jgi:hypothetical protein
LCILPPPLPPLVGGAWHAVWEQTLGTEGELGEYAWLASHPANNILTVHIYMYVRNWCRTCP